MYYEHLLYRLDTNTVLLKPEEITTQEVTGLATVFRTVTVADLTQAEWASLYCFPMGAYTYLLRHYGLESPLRPEAIPVIEGIAVQRAHTRIFAMLVSQFIERQGFYLNALQIIGDIDAATQRQSDRHSLMITRMGSPQVNQAERSVIAGFAPRQQTHRLLVPFTADGRNLLMGALTDPLITPLIRFAFGAPEAVIKAFERIDITFDVIGSSAQQHAQVISREQTPSSEPKTVVVHNNKTESISDRLKKLLGGQ